MATVRLAPECVPGGTDVDSTKLRLNTRVIRAAAAAQVRSRYRFEAKLFMVVSLGCVDGLWISLGRLTCCIGSLLGDVL